MLWLRNLALGWGLVEYGKARFNMLGNASHWFPGTKPSLLAEVDPRAIARAVAASPYAARIPSELAQSVTLLGGAEVKRLSESD
jgi:predicted aldo/keto reductase-like oxidoreductase